MPLLKNLVPQIDVAEIWKTESGGREPRPAVRKMVDALIPQALLLIRPVLIYDLFRVTDVRHNRLTLNGDKRLTGADAAHILGPAEEVAVGVATIGTELDARVAELFAAGEAAQGYLLDVIGTAAVTNLVQQGCGHLAEVARARGLPLGFPISPGDPGWPLSEQRVLFQLVDASSIGVRLTDVCLMIPQKSISFAVGLGRGVLTAEEGSQCDICSLRETCRYRA